MSFFDRLYHTLQNECVQQPLLYSFGTGGTVGMLHFVFTGLVERSLKVGCALLFPISIGGCLFCLYTDRIKKIKASQFQAANKFRILTEGTALDKSFKYEKDE